MPEESHTAISVKNISKSFRLPHEKITSIKSAVLNFSKRQHTYEKQTVLKDISLDIQKGEFFGIVGKNGSGKSTLLKLLAGIYTADEGSITVHGRLTPFIELGVGFNPELTGRENVYLNGALLGFSRKEMGAMYDSIVRFAELGKFMDQKLKNYSSGMQVRLAFSIAIRAKSDILLIDEVLAVGDESFQQKCYATFERLKAQNKTIVFVSHDMGAVQRFCKRAVLLHEGEIVAISHPQKIADMYNKINDDSTKEAILEAAESQKPSLLSIELIDASTKHYGVYDYGEYMSIRLGWDKNPKIRNAGVAIYKQTGEYIFGTNTYVDSVKLKGNEAQYRVKLELGDGNYFIVAGLFGATSHDIIEITADGPQFQVHAKRKKDWEGLTHLEHEWKA